MSVKKQGEEGHTPVVALFSTEGGVRTVGGMIQMRILAMLKEEDLSFDQIVARSGRAKSTVSVHLKGLVEGGVLTVRTDPVDRRKKIFSLASRHLGDLSSGDLHRSDLSTYLMGYAGTDAPPPDFFRLLFQTLRVTLLADGINIDPLLFSTGLHVGEAIAPTVAGPDLATLLGNLTRFWEKHRLGRVEVISLDPITLYVYDCFECGDLPNIGRPACAFDAGLLSAVFSDYYHRTITAQETACYAMGDDHCCFVVAVPEIA
jgi:predicted hydrocarbon binding protein